MDKGICLQAMKFAVQYPKEIECNRKFAVRRDTMAAVMKKDWGKIEITDGVIAKMAGLSATECMGVLGLASSDGWTDLLKKDSVDRGVRINSNEDTVKIEINIIVKYGVSIAAVAQNVIDSTKYNVETMTGMNVECVDVCVRSIRL